VIEFRAGELDQVIAEMQMFAREADGRRWVNLAPMVDPDEIATGSRLGRLFSSRGPVIPLATWFPEHTHRGATEPTQLGIAHAAGKDAVPRLAERGVSMPAEWVLVQDHQHRGIVMAIPPWAELDGVVTYVARALVVLSPFDFDGRFQATFSRG